MPRFNFNELTLQSAADITKIQANFEEIEDKSALKSEIIDIQENYTPTSRTIAGESLEENISATTLLNALGAVSTDRKIATLSLEEDISSSDLAAALKQAMGNLLYPIGSIYFSVRNTNPESLFGGTWVAWGAGRVPVGVNNNDADYNTVEKTGGNKSHKLTIAELPKHSLTGFYVKGTDDMNFDGGTYNRPAGADAESNSNTLGKYTTDSIGGDKAFDIKNPYITCYMWKRTA